MTQTIFCLCHRHGLESRAVDTKVLGWHTSRATAEAAISGYLDVPGFRRFPSGFYIAPVPIDVLLWPDGFDDATAPREFMAEMAGDGTGTVLRSVHIVWHAFENPAEVDHERLVGVFSTSECAARAVEHSLTLPGFIDHPDGFIMGYGDVGERKWKEGFVTVDGREPPPLRSLITGAGIECIDDAGRLLLSVDGTLVLLDEMDSVGVRLRGVRFNDVWLADVRVMNLANGGQGGFRIVAPEPLDADRVMAEVRLDDSDGVQVIARLTVDSDGMPYDVDLVPAAAWPSTLTHPTPG